MIQRDFISTREHHGSAAPPSGSMWPASSEVGTDEFREAFGESLSQALDLQTWQPGEHLAALYERLQAEIDAAVRQEDRLREQIRREVFPRLRTRTGAPEAGGVWRATPDALEGVHRGLLFTGAVEACDGTSAVHDTLPVAIVQLGVCLVSYQGDQGSWVNRLYRRDLRLGAPDPLEEMLEVLERRRGRSGFDESSPRDRLTDLARRGLMAYAERAVLLHASPAPWRLGHGHPTPWELLTGSGMPELASLSLDLLHALVVGHRRFVFVPSGAADRTALTIGNALYPLEYAIIDTVEDALRRTADGHYRGQGWSALQPRVQQFVAEVGSQVVKGVYRASPLAPPQLFYAHAGHAHEAALIVLADSVLHSHRGFPMLLDLADTVCSDTFGASSLTTAAQVAYAEAGAPFRYLTERQTRRL